MYHLPPLHEIEYTHLESLIENKIREDLFIEYKSHLSEAELWVKDKNLSEKSKFALFKEIIAFINASGGHLILGIQEEKGENGVPKKITPILNIDTLEESLFKSFNRSIDPPCLTVKRRVIKRNKEDTNGVLVVECQPSHYRPHGVPINKDETDNKKVSGVGVFRRDGGSSDPVSMKGIQEMSLLAYTESERRNKRLKEFRSEFDNQKKEHTQDRFFRITMIPLQETNIDLPLTPLQNLPTLTSEGKKKFIRCLTTGAIYPTGFVPGKSGADAFRSGFRCLKRVYPGYKKEKYFNYICERFHEDGSFDLFARGRGSSPYIDKPWFEDKDAHITFFPYVIEVYEALCGVLHFSPVELYMEAEFYTESRAKHHPPKKILDYKVRRGHYEDFYLKLVNDIRGFHGEFWLDGPMALEPFESLTGM